VDESPWHRHEAALDEAYQALAEWFIQAARRGALPPLEITLMLLRQLHVARNGGDRPARPCGVGTGLLGISPEGTVLPCHRFLYRPQDALGHVSVPELPPERLRYVHLSAADMLGCNTCEARLVCGGGCRAVAVNFGLPLESGTTPGYCITTRAHHRAVSRIYDTLMAEQNPHLLRALGRSRIGSRLSALYSQ
jgi:radical SAM protein with 4Fe4S-binding SPASM domain